MLNEARRSGIISTVPGFAFPKVSRRAVNEDHRETLIYEIDGDLLGTLDRIHAAITDDELRLAFICGASFGPRTEDLLTLTWANFDLTGERPVVRYVAEKTGTFHVVPLAGWLAGVMRASQSDPVFVFPTLISHKSKDPRKSRASRRAVSGLKAAALAAGFEFAGRKPQEQKPFQVLRATCNERFERHHRRAGEWILGHGMTGVNRTSYQNPGSDIYLAVNSLPQPASFTKGL
jgi:integrase